MDGDFAYIGQQLSRPLVQAVAEVADVRPADPITHIADSLRTYHRRHGNQPDAQTDRCKEGATRSKTTQQPLDRTNSSQGETKGTTQLAHNPLTSPRGDAAADQVTCDDVAHDDWIDADLEEAAPLVPSSSRVHAHFHNSFGDLFDDDDLS